MKNLNLLVIAGLLITANSCKKGCTDPAASNYDEKAKKENNSCIYPVDELQVPSTYAFTDANNASTVDFSGQTVRLEMLLEIVEYMETANTSGTTISATTLKNMYANNGYTWTDANGLGLNGTTKQLKDKTAYATADGSPDFGVQQYFEDLLDSAAVASTSVNAGSPGTTGVWPADANSGARLMSGKGHEYAEIMEKGIMSAVFASQMTVNYLGTVGDDDNTTPESGKTYTAMQHHWDEAYGYFTSGINYPTSGADKFWGKYANGRESDIQSATKISAAFRKGRAAIDAKSYDVRDAQIIIIRDEIEKLQAACAIHYLNGVKNNLSNPTARNHQLSEAYGFIHGMKYGYNCISGAGMTSSEIDQALAYIGDDFNAINITNLNLAIDLIASKTGLDSIKNDL